MKGKTCAHTRPRVHDIELCHLTRAARVPPHFLWRQLLPPGSGQLGAATCPVAPAPESQLGAARVLPCVPWRQLPPCDTGQLRSRHVSHGSSSSLLAQGSSGATTCPMEIYGLWAIEVKKYQLMTLSSWSSIGTCAYLPRRDTTMLIPRACETCSGRYIKCYQDMWAWGLQDHSRTTPVRWPLAAGRCNVALTCYPIAMDNYSVGRLDNPHRAVHACDLARRQDSMTSIPLKTSSTTPNY
jgi:hypothetical protein